MAFQEMGQAHEEMILKNVENSRYAATFSP